MYYIVVVHFTVKKYFCFLDGMGGFINAVINDYND